MLVLSRKLNESIVIDNNIVVTVVKIGPGVVRIGVAAPNTYSIHRKELLESLEAWKVGVAKDKPRSPTRFTPSPTHGEAAPHSPPEGPGPPVEDSGEGSAGRPGEGAERTSPADLLSAAERLDASELEDLIQGVLALRARRVAPRVPAAESELILLINRGLPGGDRQRYEQLVEKLEDESLTDEEHDELDQLGDELERLEVSRLEALTRLATIRRTTLPELMNSMGIGMSAHG